ncbi:hypothetical protein [Streptomyces piniterrae]|uniref:hypothetical protein n=1 Tax=Streptomyces piniterrae TaxID=2571125 RepID=UPI001FE6CFE5|nr:hypothetical protein [Streptomyces piniterrae]
MVIGSEAVEPLGLRAVTADLPAAGEGVRGEGVARLDRPLPMGDSLVAPAAEHREVSVPTGDLLVTREGGDKTLASRWGVHQLRVVVCQEPDWSTGPALQARSLLRLIENPAS